MNRPLRDVLIADDHPVSRRGLRSVLEEFFEGVTVTEAGDGPSALDRLDDQSWSLVMIDAMMPGMTLVELIEAIRARLPEVPILVFTGAVEVSYVLESLKAGANGLVHKHRMEEELTAAVRQVMAGENYLHPETAVAVASHVRDDGALVHEKLSKRELEVFCLIAVGRAVKEVAADLDLSDKTVATHLSRIREKTGLQSHVEIARYALKHNLVD